MTQNSNSGLNDKTGLPHRMSLGDVLADINLPPSDITAFLYGLAEQFFGGASHNLGQALRDHAALVSDPQTYGYQPPTAAAATADVPYTPPTRDNLSYAEVYGNAPRPASAPTPATVTGEPAWMADARAAGWNPNPPDATSKPADLPPVEADPAP